MGDRFDLTRLRERIADRSRLAAVARTELLDAPPDATLDGWARRARTALDAPVAAVSLVGERRTFFAGVAGADATGRSVAHGDSLCPYVVGTAAPLAVGDAREHLDLRAHAVVAYAGVPIVVEGEVVGALCAMDARPREWTGAQLHALRELAASVSVEVELRAARAALAHARALVGSLNRVHELIADDAPLPEILATLVRCFEATDPALAGSVLLLDGVTLRHGAAPGLPAAFVAAVDGVTIGPAVGTCGAAAWWGHEVVTEDIARDPAWAAFRPLAAAHGLAHCWSAPIKARGGAVLGTFALYGRRPRAPRQEHLLLMRDASRLAGIAIERARALELLRHEATHDALTGLPNRRLVDDRLGQALARSQRSGAVVVVAFLDLDRIKLINDAQGHAAGDAVIRAVAVELSRATRPGDTLGRFGGDEFVAVAEGIAPDAADPFGERLRTAVTAAGARLGTKVTASVGFAVVGGTCEPAEALRRADGAMYAAKRAGGDRVVGFSRSGAPVPGEPTRG